MALAGAEILDLIVLGCLLIALSKSHQGEYPGEMHTYIYIYIHIYILKIYIYI